MSDRDLLAEWERELDRLETAIRQLQGAVLFFGLLILARVLGLW